ncbi:cyclic nucleotide-binding domain-containing protein [Brachyspira murdochii]|uniref:cyclic nucleotide-binding domain-containing protein n=1 Tax=Brachyspira murdochii TaxID=84378 RepID=UPI0012F50D66|nr:cyclic nucleotide-binding domain-containing protein [Brachyspira murdochii]
MMINYNKINFKKSSTLFISGQYPDGKFYIINKGKVIFESYFADNFKYEHKKGDIIGIVSAVMDEPYFSTSKVIEDTEVIEIDVREIEKIDNVELMNKIYKHLINTMEVWVKKYYYFLYKYSKVDSSEKLNITDICKSYIDKGFLYAAIKIYENNQEKINDKNVVNKISKIEPIESPKEITKGVFSFKKGSCLFEETSQNNYIYFVKSGIVGVYSYFNHKPVTRMKYYDNDIFGYKDLLGKKVIANTAIVLEDSIIKIMDKKEFENMIIEDKATRVYLIKMMSARVYNTIARIKAININNIILKILTVIEGLIKLDLMFKKTNYIALFYTIDDILSMVFIDHTDYVEREIKKIKSIKITDEKNIVISNINNFFKEYQIYFKRNSDKINNEDFGDDI